MSPTELDETDPSEPMSRRLSPVCQATSGIAAVTSIQLKNPMPAIGVSVRPALTALTVDRALLTMKLSGLNARSA